MRFACRLEGGPYDGDSGTLTLEALPEAIYAFRCGDGCKVIHWSTVVETRSSERYDYDRLEDGKNGQTSVYVHSDVNLSDLPTIAAREHEPVAA